MATPRDKLAALAAIDVYDPIPMATLAPILSASPFIPTRSLVNIRDLGAIPGSAIPSGRIYRSGTLDNAAQDPDAIRWLSSNVKRIFDLRKASERERYRSPELPGVETVWFETVENYPSPKLEEFVEGDGSQAWGKHYLITANVHKPVIRAVLEHVRDRPTEPFLFHCTAGRDRTGVVAGLLQGLGGTPPDDVVLDFMLSRVGTEPAREKLMAFLLASLGTDDPTTPGMLNVANLRPTSWNAFLDGIRKEYGGWDGYVTMGLGFSEQDLEKIKQNLRS